MPRLNPQHICRNCGQPQKRVPSGWRCLPCSRKSKIASARRKGVKPVQRRDSPDRLCKICGAVIPRVSVNGRKLNAAAYATREFCSMACCNKWRKQPGNWQPNTRRKHVPEEVYEPTPDEIEASKRAIVLALPLEVRRLRFGNYVPALENA